MNSEVAKTVWKILIAIFIGATMLVVIGIVILNNWKPHGFIKDYKQFLDNNEPELTLYADMFLEQDTVQWISRNKFLCWVSYGIEVSDSDNDDTNNQFSFTVSENDSFYKDDDFSKIREDDKSSDLTLDSFLEAKGISQEEFLYWRDFLDKYDFAGISLEDNGLMVRIADTAVTGFLHHKFMSNDYGYGPDYIDILDPRWAYLDEGGIKRSGQ